jgi:tRNA pseudouridine32 synthase / 23S rRNA pseudouridine746 synthase
MPPPSSLLADRVLFIDAEAMIVDKPAGLPVDAPRDGSLSVMNHLESLRFGFERQPMIVHRLDRDTSGCLLLARNPRIQKKLSQAFEAGAVTKHYLAVLEGMPVDASGTIDMALGKVSSREAGWQMVPDAKGQRAVTHWELLANADGRALVRFRPETGRTHQLRVHAASGLGFGIAGDPVYAKSAAHMLLHAEFLSAPRVGKAPVEARAPLPEHFPDWARDALA